jgi:hypothetical protein
MTKTIQEIKTDFERAFAEVSGILGLSAADRVMVAIAVLEQFGKYNRGEAANTARMNGNGNNGSDKPISEKQVKFLQDLGAESIPKTSREANALITQLKAKRGR